MRWAVKNWRCSFSTGSRSSAPSCAPSAAARAPPSGRAPASTETTTHQGWRWTRRASRLKKPSSGATSPRRRTRERIPGTRCSDPGCTRWFAPSASSAGTRVRATSSAIATTDRPAAPVPARIAASKKSSPPRLIPTVTPLKTTVRPAVAIVRPSAVARSSRPARRRVPDDGAQLVAEPADHQQPVVDAQAETEDGDDVDDGGVEVDEVREAQQGRQPAGDRGHRAEDRDARREEPAEDHDHHQQRHRQRDALAGAQVLLDLVVDGVDQLGEAADLRRRTGFDRPHLLAEHPQAGAGRVEGVVTLLAGDRGVEGDGDEEAVAVLGHQDRAPRVGGVRRLGGGERVRVGDRGDEPDRAAGPRARQPPSAPPPGRPGRRRRRSSRSSRPGVRRRRAARGPPATRRGRRARRSVRRPNRPSPTAPLASRKPATTSTPQAISTETGWCATCLPRRSITCTGSQATHEARARGVGASVRSTTVEP